MIKLSSSRRGGVELESVGGLYLTKGNEWLNNKIDYSTFKGWKVLLNCKKRKLSVLLTVIRYLYD